MYQLIQPDSWGSFPNNFPKLFHNPNWLVCNPLCQDCAWQFTIMTANKTQNYSSPKLAHFLSISTLHLLKLSSCKEPSIYDEWTWSICLPHCQANCNTDYCRPKFRHFPNLLSSESAHITPLGIWHLASCKAHPTLTIVSQNFVTFPIF